MNAYWHLTLLELLRKILDFMATPRLVKLIDGYREAHGVSEAELARRVGVSREICEHGESTA